METNASKISEDNDSSNKQTNNSQSIRKRKRELKKSELNSIEYQNKPKTISNLKCKKNYVYDKLIPASLLKNELTNHNLDNILKLFILIVKDTRSCPFQLTKTGYLLFKNFLNLKPNLKDELSNNLLNFFKTYKKVFAIPVVEFFLDFLILSLDTDNENLLSEFSNPSKHVRPISLNNKHMVLCFNMFQAFTCYRNFFKEFKDIHYLNYTIYEEDDIMRNDYTHVCLQLEKMTIGNESDSNYPLDYLFLQLIDLIILKNDIEEAKQYLLEYNKQYSSNLNSIIYILKFNEIYLNDDDLFNKFYDKLRELDPSNCKLLYYIDKIDSNLEILKILLNYVDYIQNKDDYKAWKLICKNLKKIKKKDENSLKKYYDLNFKSYWPSYHFASSTENSNIQNKNLSQYKLFAYNFFK